MHTHLQKHSEARTCTHSRHCARGKLHSQARTQKPLQTVAHTLSKQRGTPKSNPNRADEDTHTDQAAFLHETNTHTSSNTNTQRRRFNLQCRTNTSQAADQAAETLRMKNTDRQLTSTLSHTLIHGDPTRF